MKMDYILFVNLVFEETKKLINYINKNKDKIEPGFFKKNSLKSYGASYDRIQRDFLSSLFWNRSF